MGEKAKKSMYNEPSGDSVGEDDGSSKKKQAVLHISLNQQEEDVGSATSHSAPPARSPSTPGAFPIDHPDAALRRQQQNPDNDIESNMGDDEPGAPILIPSATLVTQEAQVTYASDLVHASPMEEAPQNSRQEQATDKAEKQESALVPRDSLVIKRRYFYIGITVLLLVAAALATGLTVWLKNRNNEPPFPRPPPPLSENDMLPDSSQPKDGGGGKNRPDGGGGRSGGGKNG